MRTRTIVVAGTGAAAVAYLFDPRRGGARRERVRNTIRTITGLQGIEGATALPQNLAPARSLPIGQPQNLGRLPEPSLDEPMSATTTEASRDEPMSVRTPQPSRDMPTSPTRLQPPRDPVGSPSAAAGDAGIVHSVRTALEERRDLGTDDLLVDVVNGVVYLSGALHDRQTFGEVVDLTGQVPGVRRVQSLLHLPDSETISRAITGRGAGADR
jgi:hypothetical protein